MYSADVADPADAAWARLERGGGAGGSGSGGTVDGRRITVDCATAQAAGSAVTGQAAVTAIPAETQTPETQTKDTRQIRPDRNSGAISRQHQQTRQRIQAVWIKAAIQSVRIKAVRIQARAIRVWIRRQRADSISIR